MAFGAFAASCLALAFLGAFGRRVRARFRERRLEVKYPWLAKSADSASAGGAPSAGPGARRPSGSRRAAQLKLTAGFTDRMAAVHDSTLSVGLSWEGLCVDGAGKRLLHRVDGALRAGRVTALMGPSGAGKSTLLHALSGKLTPSKGRVLINGSAASTVAQLRKLVGFVPQDDILLGALTVKETLRFHATLRLPTHVSEATREGWVDDVVDLLGLTDVKHSVIGDEKVILFYFIFSSHFFLLP